MEFWGTIYRYLSPVRREADVADPTEASSPSSSESTKDSVPDFSVWPLLNGAALQVGTVFRCVRLLSESVANLPLMYMRLKGGIFVEDTDSSLHYLLTVEPSPNYNAFDFWAKVVEEMLLDGNAYIVPIKSSLYIGEYDRLVLCSRGSVSYDDDSGVYTVTDSYNHLYGVYREDEIVHIKNVSGRGNRGLSTLGYARLTTDIARQGDRETLNRFTNGGNVMGLLTNDKRGVVGVGDIQDKRLAALADSTDNLFRDGKRIVSIPGQAEFKQLSLSSTDMQFLESRKFTVREICRFFGVHPTFVFDDTNNNYKSVEMANVAFLSNTLNPILRKIECELRRKLVSRKFCCKRKFEFDRRSLYTSDLDSRVKYQMQTISAGIYTINDWRRMENQPSVDGGDAVLVSANLKSLDQLKAETQEIKEVPAGVSGEPGLSGMSDTSNDKDNKDDEGQE